MAKRSHIYVVDDDNPHVDVKSSFRFSTNKFAATRDIDHIQVRTSPFSGLLIVSTVSNRRLIPVRALQMDLLMVFGSTFLLMFVAYYLYWICLKRANLFGRVALLREDHLLKPQLPQTPRNFPETGKNLVSSPFGVQIKLEQAD